MDTSAHPGPVGAVVALKRGELAKSRLAGIPAPLRRRLAWTMAVDTLSALAAAVDRLVVVGEEPGLAGRLGRDGVDAEVLGEQGRPGMNAALATGDAALRGLGCAVVLAAVGDLPALRPASLRHVVTAAAGRAGARSFLADASGTGTTMLLAAGTPLLPRFQGPSARAHAESGAYALAVDLGGEVPDARRDVDTLEDLAVAARLGLGPATAALAAADPLLGRLVLD